jgi:formate-dependent nitrite reductase membrane component NrfD
MRIDGRNVDEHVGALAGEAAQLEMERPDQAFPVAGRGWSLPAKVLRETPTYYGLGALKEPVWKWAIPSYFHVGGLAGALSVLGATADLFGGPKLHSLARRCHQISAVAELFGAGLLIYDLGRPSRFLNMLRVFRPSSPMSVGSWILSLSGAASTSAVLLGRRKILGRAASVVAGLLGAPLAGYTGVLLGGTAVPLWQSARRTLPLLFLASSVASGGALLCLSGVGSRRESEVVRRFAAAGQAAELMASLAMEQELARHPRVARPLQRGASAGLWRAAQVVGAGALVASLWPGRSRRRLVAGLLGTLAGLALRFSVHHAGRISARDPVATFQQRR